MIVLTVFVDQEPVVELCYSNIISNYQILKLRKDKESWVVIHHIAEQVSDLYVKCCHF